MKILGQVFKASGNRPTTRVLYTQTNAKGRSPRLDLIMDDMKLQPYIHDAIVTVKHKKKSIRFHIFVKNHKKLPLNKSIRRWPQVNWRGDIIVMRKGKNDEFVNIRSGEGVLADFVAKK